MLNTTFRLCRCMALREIARSHEIGKRELADTAQGRSLPVYCNAASGLGPERLVPDSLLLPVARAQTPKGSPLLSESVGPHDMSINNPRVGRIGFGSVVMRKLHSSIRRCMIARPDPLTAPLTATLESRFEKFDPIATLHRGSLRKRQRKVSRTVSNNPSSRTSFALRNSIRPKTITRTITKRTPFATKYTAKLKQQYRRSNVENMVKRTKGRDAEDH